MPTPLDEGDLVLCSGTIGRAPLPAAVPIAAAAGFRGLSVYYVEYLAARAAGWSDASLRALLDDHDVAIAELDGAMSWLPTDLRGDTRAPSCGEFVDVAAALGARSITVLETEGRRVGTDRSLDEVAGAFAAVCDRAADGGLLAHLEYFPFSGIPDLATADAVASAAGRANGGVLLDVWHHTRGPDAGRTDFGEAGPRILGVQANDVLAHPAPDLAHEMMHERLLPGTGAANVARVLRALRDQGCTAPFGVEVYSDELHARGAPEAARLAASSMRTVLRVAGLAR